MKVLHVLWYAAIGGVESYTQRLFPELEARGHENILLIAGKEPDSSSVTRSIYYLRDVIGTTAAVSTLAFDTVRKIIEERSPDVALVHTALDSNVARLISGQMATVFYAHNYGPICPSGALLYERTGAVCNLSETPNWRCIVNAYTERCNTRRPNLLLQLYKRALDIESWTKDADEIVCGSRYVAERYAQAGFDQSRLNVLPYPVPLPAASSLQPPPTSNRTILYSGRLVAQKGVETLLDAMEAINNDWRLVIAGEGPLLHALQNRARAGASAARIEFLGPIAHEKMSDLYRSASIVVVPSIWPEPMGMVGPEAFAHLRPVVASRIGGISEWLIDATTGLGAEPGDAHGLAAQVNRLIDDRALAIHLAEEGRKLVERRFTFGHHSVDLLSVFGRARSRRAAAPIRVSTRK